jgi:hypothetical protein
MVRAERRAVARRAIARPEDQVIQDHTELFNPQDLGVAARGGIGYLLTRLTPDA